MVLETENASVDSKPLIIQATHSPAESLQMKLWPTPNSVDDCIEMIVSWIEETAGQNYFIRLLGDFQARYGKVNPEDDFYQSRMNYFLEHTVLEHPMSDGRGLPPVSCFFDLYGHLTKNAAAGAEIWASVSGFRHGIFQVQKNGSDAILVKDLITDISFEVVSKSGETLKYLRRKSIFQGFVFGNFKQRVLGAGLIVHPDGATIEILKFLKRYRKYPTITPQELLRFFALTNMRYLRMQHVDPAVIYSSICG